MSDSRTRRPWWTRRGFLQGSAAVLAGIYGLPGRLGYAAEVPNEFDGSKFQLKAPEPNAKSGGVLRYGITMRPPHFDVHQSGTINNLGSQGCMFDNLIRRDPRNGGKTIIPDLAHSWEIAKDGKTYTFHLRQGVHFHDGAELTSEDVKARRRSTASSSRRRASASRAAFCSSRSARSPRPTNTPCSSNWPSRARSTSSCRRSPAAGTSSSARRPWRTTPTTCARSR